MQVSVSRLLCLVGFVSTLAAHAPPTPIPALPVHVKANLLVDANGLPFLLRSVGITGVEAFSPTPADLAAQAALTPFTFRIIQQRWNMNAVRLPVSVWVWKRDGQSYLDQIASVVAAANSQKLIVVITACADSRCGAADDTGLPGADTLNFWQAAAQYFKDTPGVIFSLYDQPSTRAIPGSAPTTHRPADWQVWLKGGSLTNNRTAVGMQTLVDAIRAVGAKQIIAAPAFQDPLDFQGLGPDSYLSDPNTLYEAHPFFDHALTDDARTTNFGFLLSDFPVFAGAWGAAFGVSDASCIALPQDPVNASFVLLQTLSYFDFHNVSWSVAGFAPGNLIREFDDYAVTSIGPSWNCDTTDGRTGIGQVVLLWMTGDPNGFGSLDPQQVASAAGGPVGPVAPGEIIALYGQSVGPPDPVGPRLDSGVVSSSLGDVQVFFDGAPAPLLLAGGFQVNVQVPYEAAGHQTTTVQLIYRGIPSNKIELSLIDAAPGLFTNFVGGSEAQVLNEDGTVNHADNPAPLGSVVSLFATGTGATIPSSATGVPAVAPLPSPALKVGVSFGSRPAGVLFAGSAPGLVGVTQINARIPVDLPLDAPPQRASVVVTVGSYASRSGVVLWVK